MNPLQQELVRKVARDGESGVQHSFNIKMGKYSDRCEAEGIEFIPLIVDTFGGWHKESLEVVSKLGRQVSRQTGKEEEEIVRQLRQRVAIQLVRDNVNMFDSICHLPDEAALEEIMKQQEHQDYFGDLWDW